MLPDGFELAWNGSCDPPFAREQRAATALERRAAVWRLAGVDSALLGQTFGQLTVTGPASPIREPSGRVKRRVIARCTCGVVITVRLGNLRYGRPTSCGCGPRPQPHRRMVLAGQQFGHWTTTGGRETRGSNLLVEVTCDCGSVRLMRLETLRTRARLGYSCRDI